MKVQWSCRATVITVLVVSVGFLISPSRAQAVSSFGGEATGAIVTAAGITIKAATGQLPPTGGSVDASLLSGDIPGSATGGAVSLTAGVLHSVAVGLDVTDAEASMADVSLTVSGNGITADFLMAQSTASCGSGPAVVGSSQLPNLVINGQAITVTGSPNQSVSLPNGTAVINEQTPTVAGSTGDLRVVALHVTTTDPITGQVLADVKLAIADAMIDCQPGSGPPGNFTSGGGWISVSGGKATFGVHGGTQPDGSPAGHLVYIDHGAGNLTVQSTSISTATTGCPSTIEGDGTSNRGPVHFVVDVTDRGEPGTGDSFDITVTGALTYAAGGPLLGGNIQARRQPPCP